MSVNDLSGGRCDLSVVINGLMAHTRQMNVASDQKVTGSQDDAPFLSSPDGMKDACVTSSISPRPFIYKDPEADSEEEKEEKGKLLLLHLFPLVHHLFWSGS